MPISVLNYRLAINMEKYCIFRIVKLIIVSYFVGKYTGFDNCVLFLVYGSLFLVCLMFCSVDCIVRNESGKPCA